MSFFLENRSSNLFYQIRTLDKPLTVIILHTYQGLMDTAWLTCCTARSEYKIIDLIFKVIHKLVTLITFLQCFIFQ